MSKEYVIDYTDEATGNAVKLDLNNGYVYDLSGNQIAKWSPKDSTTKEHEKTCMAADYVSSLSRRYMLTAAGDPELSMRACRAAARGEDAERLVAMDLGTTDVHIPSAMPNFAGGYGQFRPIADMVASPLLTSKPADKYFVWDRKDALQSALPILGAGAGNVPEVPPRVNNSTFTTTEYALGGFVSSQIEAAADAPLRVRNALLKRVLNNLLLQREIRVMTLATTSGNWASNNVATVGAGFQWNGGASSDPIKDIHNRMEASDMEITGMAMSETAFHAFQRNPAVQKFFTYKTDAKALPSPDQMTAILELPPIYVGRMRYLLPSTSATTLVWGNNVVLFRQSEQMPPVSQDDIMSMLTFRWNATNVPDATSGAAFASSGGFLVREFFNQVRGSMGGNQLVVVHHDTEVTTASTVGGLLVNCIQ